jgi:predicted AAA+ superfamily ATPase
VSFKVGQTIKFKPGKKVLEGKIEEVRDSILYVKVANRHSWIVKKERVL